MWLKLLVKVSQRRGHEHIDEAQQVVLGDAIVEAELVEQPALIASPPPHHRAASAVD